MKLSLSPRPELMSSSLGLSQQLVIPSSKKTAHVGGLLAFPDRELLEAEILLVYWSVSAQQEHWIHCWHPGLQQVSVEPKCSWKLRNGLGDFCNAPDATVPSTRPVSQSYPNLHSNIVLLQYPDVYVATHMVQSSQNNRCPFAEHVSKTKPSGDVILKPRKWDVN